MAKQIKYTEPSGYFSKEQWDKLNGKKTEKKPAAKKTTKKAKK